MLSRLTGISARKNVRSRFQGPGDISARFERTSTGGSSTSSRSMSFWRDGSQSPEKSLLPDVNSKMRRELKGTEGDRACPQRNRNFQVQLRSYGHSGGASAARTRVSPLATGEMTTSDTQTPPQLPHHKVKIKKTGQRACNEKNEKGKLCGGHLKRWFYATDVIEQACGDAEKAWGKNAEVYRCEHCKTLYLPSPEDAKVNVAGKGRISVFGLTLPPKEK
jgi:hypothetical protein